MMRVLYDEEHEREDTYRFQINAGGPENFRLSNGSKRTVEIVFINGRFHRATDDVDGSFRSNRDYLRLQKAIAEKVDEIEARHASDNRPSLKDASPEDVRIALNVPPYPDASEKQD